MRCERIAAKSVLRTFFLAVLCVLAVCDFLPTRAEEPDQFAQWVAAIEEFEQHDAANPTRAGGTVFVGSSSIRLWDLDKHFHSLNPQPLNRGFGGSQIADATHFANRLVLKHRPRTIVFYSGDNDIASGKSAAQVTDDFAAFCKTAHAELPETRIIFIAIKPSPARWKFAEEQQAANGRIQKLCDDDERLAFVDIWTPMLGDDGQPRRELFVDDMLHLSDAGYELWSKLVRQKLEK